MTCTECNGVIVKFDIPNVLRRSDGTPLHGPLIQDADGKPHSCLRALVARVAALELAAKGT